jgi:murein DD-endopeptidase MepM/ murein hydrolase activator NlpD
MPITVHAAVLTVVLAASSLVTQSAGLAADRPGWAAPAAGGPAAVAPVGGYRWPLYGSPAVVRPFDPPPRPWLPGHRGVDLAGVAGAPVYAAGTGVVRFAGQLAGRGVVSIDHADGLRTTYEPVQPSVAAGQQVRAGDRIGVLDPGHPGCPAAACLHWGLRRGDRYLDPLSLLGLGRVRLLPFDDAAD